MLSKDIIHYICTYLNKDILNFRLVSKYYNSKISPYIYDNCRFKYCDEYEKVLTRNIKNIYFFDNN